MKHLYILNPAAGGRKYRFEDTKQMLNQYVNNLTDPYEIYVTKAPADAISKVTAEADSGIDLRVYACGGDGTLNECVCGAANRDNVAVAHFPCGTGNDFIKTFGSDNADSFRDLHALSNGITRHIDLIECNGRFGINICSVGIDARIGADVHKYSGFPVIGGAMGYVTSLAVNVIKGVSQRFSISFRDCLLVDDFTLICACNGRFYGGGFNPVPNALPHDGLLDFLIVRAVSRAHLIKVVSKYANGRFCELGDIVSYSRGDSIRISSDSSFVVNIDGEIISSSDVSFSIVPKGIRFIFPANLNFFNHDSL